MVTWKKSIRADWQDLTTINVEVKGDKEAVQGKEVEIVATLHTAGHSPDELKVEVLHGPLDLWDNFKIRYVTQLKPLDSSPQPGASVVFTGQLHLEHTGLYGYEVRVTPFHPNLSFSHRFSFVHRG
jgi:starch phosphorylase